MARCPDTRTKLICSLMLEEGLRRGEVATLQLGDLDLAGRLMLVRGKGGTERVLPITDDTFELILAYTDETGFWRGGPVIRSKRDPARSIKPDRVTAIVAGVMREARIRESAHSLRHTMATDSLRGGAHIRDVQRALGHKHLRTTERYLPWLVDVEGGLRQAIGGRHYGSSHPTEHHDAGSEGA